MQCTVLRSGIHVPDGLLSKEQLDKIKSALTITHVGFQQQITRQQTYFVDRKGKATIIAHQKGRELLGDAKIVNAINAGDDIKINKSNLKLMAHQEKLKQYLQMHVYSKTPGSCILELEAGQGKTFLAMGFIEEFKKRTLVIVPNETLLEQWVKVLKATFPDLTIGEYYAKAHTFGDIVVASINSLMDEKVSYKDHGAKVEEPSIKFMARFGFTVYDEIHTMCTNLRSKIFRKATSLRVLGLSATCFDRLDGMDPIAHYYVGDPISADAVLEEDDDDKNEKNEKKEEKQKFVIEATQLRYNGPLEYTNSITSKLGTISHPLMVNQFSQDPYRNRLILAETLALYKEGHCVMIFFDRVELIDAFVALLTKHIKEDEILVPEIAEEKVKAIKGGTSKEDRVIANDKSRICCVSYQCGGTGLSMPRYTAAVFAHPRRNGFKQFIKRICRIGGPDKIRKAIFIQDNRTSLKGQYYGFRTVALAYGATIETRTVDYESIK